MEQANMKHDRSTGMEKTVFRSIAFPVSAFDHLKEFQREYERRHGVRINNNEALAIILKQHRQFIAESEEHAWLDD